MTRIHVNAGAGYDVLIGKGLLNECGEIIKKAAPKTKKIAVICDDTVEALYSQAVERRLSESGFLTVKYVFKSGEASKNTKEYVKILEFLSANRLSRTDALVALGGGVTGDLAGFAAATYLRGISFVQMPTTLLAAVDSSVGGKTGINLPSGKNQAGAFYQPQTVICDIETLGTLSDDLMADGSGEIIKHAVIAGGELYDELKNRGIVPCYGERLERIIALSVKIKADIVEADEREKNIRRLLNLGHTVGHAVEKLSDYKMRHGKCVASGLLYIAELSKKKGFLDDSAFEEIVNLLKKNGLLIPCPYGAREMADIILSDKKTAGGKLGVVMIRGIGDCFVHDIDLKETEEFFKL
ncbi:MAG: 3-dehydroquinate synthase [Clostridiales bacterium]|jgi:3-dehydroquinate synthase|nr:3-dehydroquinate synthase [Clostridiales bacterium]